MTIPRIPSYTMPTAAEFPSNRVDWHTLARDLLVVSVTRVLQKQLAELLKQPLRAIGFEDNLVDLGLDSIRLMSLLETWRRTGVSEVSFTALAEKPTIAAWAELLVESGGVVRVALPSRLEGDRVTSVPIANGYFIRADSIIKDAPTSADPMTNAPGTRELVQQGGERIYD